MGNVFRSKKYKTLIIICIFAFIFPIIAMNTWANGNNFKVRVSYGISGTYKAMRYIPVQVDVSALKEGFNGEVEVRIPTNRPGYYDAYSTKVKVDKGENAKVNIPIKFFDGTAKITVVLTEDEKELYETKTVISSGRVSEGNLFTGILTDDKTALGYLGEVEGNASNPKGGPIGGKLSVVPLDKEILEGNSLNIDGLDVIIINNYNLANFKEEHYNTLKSFVNRGGTLIIGAGANESKTINAIDNSFIDVKSSGTETTKVNINGEELQLVLSKLIIPEGKSNLKSNDKDLIYRIEDGKGQILVTSFDLGIEPFASAKVASKLVSELLASKFQASFNGYNMYGGGYYGLDILMNNIPVDKVISTNVMIAILAIYVILIGFVIYFILKKMDKREYVWGILPVTAIVFSLIIYFISGNVRVKDVIVNSANIAYVNTEGKASVKGYVGIGTKYKSDLKIEKPKDISIRYANEEYYGDGSEVKNNILRVKTTYENNNAYFSFKDNAALEIKKFEVEGKEMVIPTLNSQLNLNNGNLNGSIENTLGTDIQRLVVVVGKSVWDLGSVKKGEVLKVDNIRLSQSNGLFMYSEKMMQDYYDLRWNSKNKLKDEKYRGIARYSGILSTLGNEIVLNQKAKIIAICDMPIDYEINFGNRTVSKFDTTAIVQDTNVDFKDEEGNVSFPEGYFNAVIKATDPNVSVDDYNGYIFGQGEITFEFKVDDNITPIEISIKEGSDMYGGSSGGTGKAQVYNVKLGKYEDISLYSSGYKITDVTSYLENNTLNVKMKVDDYSKGPSLIPKIIVKGREK